VPFAREVSGIGIFGDANTWWRKAEGAYPRSRTPSVGGVVVIRTYDNNSRGHVAVVTQILSDRLILVDHANWHGRQEVAVNVPVRDVSEQNDWSLVNVWWLDTNAWGAKDYLVDGFIHSR
jgi:surface antigen